MLRLSGGFWRMLLIGSVGALSLRAATTPVEPAQRVRDELIAWVATNSASLVEHEALHATPADADTAAWLVDALRGLSPHFDAGMTAFDAGAYAAARESFEVALRDPNPFVAAHARYFDWRALVAEGRTEEAGRAISAAMTEPEWDRQLAFPGEARLLLAHCETQNLRYEAVLAALAPLDRDPALWPERVRIGARQLQLETERRERGTLGEVADLMGYSERRLALADGDARVRATQEEIVALLDKLIEEQQQQEQQQGGGGRGGPPGGMPGQRPGSPQQAPEEKTPPRGQAEFGDLHTAPKADPGESWGKLPPAEREKILQKLRERYPTRYRQIVEQYYRSMAEER